MAKTLLGAAAHKANLEIIDNPNDAELAIVLGESLPNDNALNGKRFGWGYWSRRRASELFLSEAKSHATLTALLLRLFLRRAAVRNAWSR